MDINDDETVCYITSGYVIIRNMTSGYTQILAGITRFVFVAKSNAVMRPSPGESPLETDGPGILYIQTPNALFSRSNFVNNFITTNLPDLQPDVLIPPDPIEIEVVLRNDTDERYFLALNIDTTEVPDGTFELDDDVIEVTDSVSFTISSGQIVIYSGSQLLIRTGSLTDEQFQNIMAFSVLEPTVQAGISGFKYQEFKATTSPPPSLSGPATLIVGKQSGQEVAFFSTASDKNHRISTTLVDMQLNFQIVNETAKIVARFPPTMSGQKLIDLSGAQSFNFPNGASIRLMNTEVSVTDGFGRTLQKFDTGLPMAVSYFLNGQVQRSIFKRSFQIPDGGVTLYFNPSDSEVFFYPSRNQIIGAKINQAIQDANTQPVQIASFSLSANKFGIATLSAKFQNNSIDEEVEVVDVAPATVLDIESSDSLSYQGMSVEILDRDGMSVKQFAVSPLAVNLAGAQYLSSEDNFPTKFGGSGRLYVDSDMRAFFTRNQDIQNLITNFVNGIPEPKIDVVKDPDDGLIYFQAGEENLFKLNGASSVEVESNTTGIYFDNEINLVNVFKIPADAQVSHNMTDDVLQVSDPNDPGGFLFQTSAKMVFDNQEGIVKLNNDSVIDIKGFIYYSDRGALVTVNGDIDQGIVGVLFKNEWGLQASTRTIPGVMNLTVANGRNILTYTMSAPFALPRGGSYYMSSTGGNAMYIFDQELNDSASDTYSQFNPSKPVYNRTSGVLTLMTAEGKFISSLRPGVTPTANISRGASILYAKETLFFTPEIVQPLEKINQFTVWDGLMATTYSRSNDEVRFEGPGVFWYEGDMAFFTADPTTVSLIHQRITSIVSTFRAPVIRQNPRVFSSKFHHVMGGFPQTITLHEGANIALTCAVAASNPPSMITFLRRFFNETLQKFENVSIMGDKQNYRITQTEHGAKLHIDGIMSSGNVNAVNGIGVFTCVAQNIVSTSSASTTINILVPRKSTDVYYICCCNSLILEPGRSGFKRL